MPKAVFESETMAANLGARGADGRAAGSGGQQARGIGAGDG
jgi:hypothetical protein